MKKIMICSNDLRIGGIEKSLINLLENLADKFDITLVLQQKKGVLLKDVPSNVKVINYNLSTKKNKILRKIINRLKLINFIYHNKNKYDSTICYATYDYTSSILCRNISKNNILWIHSNYMKLFSGNISKFKEFFNKRKTQNFKKIVFVSNEAKNDFTCIYPNLSEKSVVINNFINSKEIMSKASLKTIKRPDSSLVIFVGRLEEESKGLLLLFDAAKKLPFIKFWIIGDGPDKTQYKNYINTNKIDNVELLGEKSNPYPYMKIADLLILPSKYEGFPVVILEALVLNQKVLSTISVSSNDFDLKDYIYITSRNIKSLKEDIVKSLDNKNKKSFNVDRFNEENLKLLLHLLGEEK